MDDFETRAIRNMYHSDPASFFDLAFRLLYPTVEYQRHWSTQVLGAALARCHRRETTRLIINMPPRTLKSLCTSVAFPAWVLAVQPTTKILCVAGHRGLAEDHHALTRSLMSHPKYRALFPHVRVTDTASKIALPHGGSRSAFTPTGAVTGRGADFIIIDDPQAAHEADDRPKSEAIREWYDGSIYQRLDDKKNGVVILVRQRLAHDDLTSHLLSHGGWELLSLPAIATEDERFPSFRGGRVVRKKGEALHPAREDRAQLRAALLQMGARAFMAQYQQDPYSEKEGPPRSGAFHVVPPPKRDERRMPRHTVLLYNRARREVCAREALRRVQWTPIRTAAGHDGGGVAGTHAISCFVRDGRTDRRCAVAAVSSALLRTEDARPAHLALPDYAAGLANVVSMDDRGPQCIGSR